MFVNTSGGGKTQQQQPLQSQTNFSVRHNNPYQQHSHTQQPHYEHHQGPVTFLAYPFCNVAPAAHASAGGNNVAVGGGQAGHMLYQAPHQPPTQPPHTPQQVGIHNAEQTLHYFSKNAPLPAHHLHHAPQQHSQIRSMIATVSHQRQSYMVPPNYFALPQALLPQQTRASILTNAAPQHAVTAGAGGAMATQLQNPAHRNVAPNGPTTYVAQPYCTPPLMLSAAPTTVTPQPASMLAAAGIGQATSLQTYAHIGGGLPAAPSSTGPMSMQSAAGLSLGPASNIEHNTTPKQRKHAIPIINPDTKEVVVIENLIDSQAQTQRKSKISVESVSIQTDNNDVSLTVSIASEPSDIVPPTPGSESVSTTDTDHVAEIEMHYGKYSDEVDKQASNFEVSPAPFNSIPDPNATTHSQSLNTGDELPKICVYEDPNDTDADTNEHELDNEDDVPEISDSNLPVAYDMDHNSPSDIPVEQHADAIPNNDIETLPTVESDTEHSTETEVKSRDEACATSLQNSLERNDEETSKDIHQELQQPSVASVAVCEPKKGRKNVKAAKRKNNQKKLKQQQNKSRNNKNVEPAKKEEPQSTRIRYSLEQLKGFADLPESRKTPVVPCQKGDCISQLFVARQQLHHHHHFSQPIGHNLSGMHLQDQTYHHMNFNESIEFMNDKRRVPAGGIMGRKYQEYHNNSTSAGNSIGLHGPAGVASNVSHIHKDMQVIHINLSLNEEIKLSECQNAWQPKFLASNSNNNSSPAESGKNINDDIEDVLKKVRGILNKLTSENFDVLLKEMTSISINTQDKMQKVMLLIFEKTVNEPNFAPTYAKFSKVLFEELKAENRGIFNALLIKRLEREFENNVNNPDAKERKLQTIINTLSEAKNEQEKIQLQAELEHEEYQFRRRAWGTVRFIGEMYKLHSLSSKRVFLYVESLLEHGNEEKLEYMCKLLTTVGNLLENGDSESGVNNNTNARMNKIFGKIQNIVKDARSSSNKKTKICSRVRFMMQDLIDLRSRNWGQSSYTQSSQLSLRRRLPEDKNSNLQSGSLNTYERGASQRLPFGNNNRNNQTRGKESAAVGGNSGSGSGSFGMQKSSKSQYLGQREQHSIDLKKLNFSRRDDSSQANTKLGNQCNYVWRNATGRQGSQTNDQQQQSDLKSPTSSHLNTAHQYPQRFQQQSHHTHSDTKAILELSCDRDNKQLLNHLLEEYLDCLRLRSNKWQEEVLNTWQKTNNKQQICLVFYILKDYLHLVGVKRLERNACALIFIYLMACNAFNKTIFTRAYDQFAVEFPDLLIDVPNGCTYVFQFLGPLLHERLITFSDIWHPNWRSDEKFTERFVNELVTYFTKEFGANYMRDLWHKEFKLDRGQMFKSDPLQWRQFVADNKLQFLYDCKAKPAIAPTNANNNSSTIMDEHLERLELILSSLNDSNLALDYINTNVNINSYFLQNLTRFLCCDYATRTKTTPVSGSSRASSTTTSKNSSTCSTTSGSSSTKNRDPQYNVGNAKCGPQLNLDAFRKNCLPLLQLCLDAHEDNELNCLESVVDAMQEQYDADIASEFICRLFDIFYDCEVIAKESFEKWYKQRQHEQKKRPLTSHLEAYMQKLL